MIATDTSRLLAAAFASAAGEPIIYTDEMTTVQGQLPAQRMVRVAVPKLQATKPKVPKATKRAKAKAGRKQAVANRRKR